MAERLTHQCNTEPGDGEHQRTCLSGVAPKRPLLPWDRVTCPDCLAVLRDTTTTVLVEAIREAWDIIRRAYGPMVDALADLADRLSPYVETATDEAEPPYPSEADVCAVCGLTLFSRAHLVDHPFAPVPLNAFRSDLPPAPCPTCQGPVRETVGMVCQTCGRDYGAPPLDGCELGAVVTWRPTFLPARVAVSTTGYAVQVSPGKWSWTADSGDGGYVTTDAIAPHVDRILTRGVKVP